MKTTVVIPTYNEAENLPGMVSAIFALPIPDLHLLVADDNSPDGTGALADRLAQEHAGHMQVLHRPGKMGLGRAYVDGFQHALEAGADVVAQMDADFSHPVEKLVEMYASIPKCDLVLGSRYIPGGKLDETWPLWRKGLSLWGSFYSRVILGLPVKDCTGGFRMWRRETLQAMPLQRVRSSGYAFQVEMLYIAHRLGFQVCEIPIYFAERVSGKSKMSFKIQREAAVRVWQLRSEYRDLHPLHRL